MGHRLLAYQIYIIAVKKEIKLGKHCISCKWLGKHSCNITYEVKWLGDTKLPNVEHWLPNYVHATNHHIIGLQLMVV